MTARALFMLMAALTAVLIVPPIAQAQCAMCVAALEQNGGEMAAGFNRGILFLLGMPYLVFGIIGATWLWKRRRKDKPLPLAHKSPSPA